MMNLGNVDANSTLYIPFHTFDSNGASITLTGLAVTDIEIYKNGSVTQRSSDAGYTLLDTDGIDFDGITGIHGFSINLSDNTDAGFYSAGAFYWVVISAVTVDTRTVNFVAATFRIGPAAANVTQLLGTAWLTPGTAGTPDVNVKLWNALTTVALPLVPTTAGRTLDVSAGGEAGVDWANVGSPTTAVNLSATNIDVDQVVASVSGAVASVTAGVTLAANAITAAATAADFTTEIQAGLATAANLATLQTSVNTLDDFVDTEIGTIITNIDALPTNAELATALGTADDAVLAQVALVKAKTDLIPAVPASTGDAMTLTAGERTTLAGVVGTTAQTESYRADGATGSIAQLLYEATAHLGESSIAGTTKTINKVDGTTPAATFTLDDATTPTSITRAT
jgi:hypothetical protein